MAVVVSRRVSARRRGRRRQSASPAEPWERAAVQSLAGGMGVLEVLGVVVLEDGEKRGLVGACVCCGFG